MDKKTVEEAIAAFDDIQPDDDNGYEKALDIFQTIGKLPVVIDKLDQDTRLCRSRLHFEDVLYTTIDEISTPQAHHVTSYGRCNRLNIPIFYCSEDRPTSYCEILEAALENSEVDCILYATISAWYTKRVMNFIIVPSPDKKDRVTNFDKYYGKAWDDNLLNVVAEEREAYTLYYQYLYKKFRQNAKNDRSPYFVTSAYTDLALSFAGNRADGIMYPSVSRGGDGLNFALRPDIITHENLELRYLLRNRFVVDNSGPHSKISENQIIHATNIDLEAREISWE